MKPGVHSKEARYVRLLDIMCRSSLAAALFLPTLLVLFHQPVPERSLHMALWAFCSGTILASLPERWVRYAIYALWLALPVNLWWTGFVALFGLGPGWEAAQAAWATNPAEIIGAIKTVAATDGFIPTACGHVGLLALATFLERLKRQAGNMPIREHSAVRKAVLLAALMPYTVSTAWLAVDPAATSIFSPTDSQASLLGSYFFIARMGLEHATFDDLSAASERPPATGTRKRSPPTLAIFVIGESVRAHSFGPDKAERGPWTKSLTDRFRNNLGALLPTTCAASNGTHRSVPMMLTGLPPSPQEDSTRAPSGTAPSGLARLKSAGFVTAWITNQDRVIFQEEGHDLYWSRPIFFEQKYDDVVLPVARTFAGPLLGARANAEKARAMVIHTYGSHFQYEDRYPRDLFPEEPSGLGAEQLETLRYERSMEYGAKILVQIAEILDQSKVPAFAVFTADHGENLLSDHNGLLRHLGSRTSIHDGTTSSLVLWNRQMSETGRPREVLAQALRADSISHQDIWHIWMSLAGIEVGSAAIDPNPVTLAIPEFQGNYRVVPCSDLKP